MDDFIELILELIIDGSIEALPNKKIPKILRIIIALKILRIIIALIPISFLIGLIILGILLLRDSVLFGSLIIGIAVLLLLALIFKIIDHMRMD